MRHEITVFFLACLLSGCHKPLSQLIKVPNQVSFQNVLIDSVTQGTSYLPCEPSIFVNPLNTLNVVAGVVLNKTLHSFDGGKTWELQYVESPYGVFGDPVICADFLGNFYYAHLADPTGEGRGSESWLDRIVIQKSDDGGKTWNGGTFTGNRPPADQDKHWLTVDPRNNHLMVTWTEFDKYGSSSPAHRSRILFSKSKDQAQTWTVPISISQREGDCLDGDHTTEGAVPAVGPQGEIYVAWSLDESIYFDRSLDGGEHWLDEDLIATKQVGGWDLDIPGLGRANGMPVTVCDISKSKYRGTIYINYCDQKFGADDTDVWLVKSTDKGQSWSQPLRVNDDGPGKHQFFTWMTVDQTTGAIYIIFYDRRNYPDNQTDVFLAYSFDGGTSFKNLKISEKPFTPRDNLFFGDYNNISSFDGVIRPIWTRMDDNKTSIWTALINFK